LNLKTAHGFSSDNFYSGSSAALFGGTTSIIDFVTPQRGQSIMEAFAERKKEASSSLIDYKLHVSPVEWFNKLEYEIQRCFEEEGVRSFKVYMAYKNTIGLNDGAIFKVMQTVGNLGGIVAVHCEMGDEIEYLRNKYFHEGNVSVEYHAKSRPMEMEALAVRRAIEIAKQAKCAIYIVHVSTKESLAYIRKAQGEMLPVYAETCPQYLLLDDGKYEGDFEASCPYVISPPLRKKEDVEELWHALVDGTIHSIGSDHCPFMLSQKRFGLDDFRNIPNGAGGIEHRLELLYTYGVMQKRISINRFVELVSGMPAKIFGLSTKKGMIYKGLDADLVVWDPMVQRVISVKTHNQHCDSNIYEGFDIQGQARHVFTRGKQVIENARLIDEPKGFYLL
jgi:dihydropyrimidinase